MNSTPAEQQPDISPEPPRKRRRLRKFFLIVFGGILLLVGLTALFGWLFIRSENFNRYVASLIKTKLNDYGLRGEIGGFDWSLSGQTARLRDFKIYNQQTGQLIGSIDRLEVVAEVREPYAFRLSREVAVKNVDLDGVVINIDIDEQGRTNFEGLRTPPSVPGRLTFDTSQLIATLTASSVHYKDLKHEIDASITDFKAVAKPQAQNGKIFDIQLNSLSGLFRYEGRETPLNKVDLTGRVSESGVDFDNLDLVSGIGEAKITGRLDEWKKLRILLDYHAKVKLEEIARVFAPGASMKGAASAKGRFEADSQTYRAKSSLSADDISFGDIRLRGVQSAQAEVDGRNDAVKFQSDQVRAQAVIVDDIRTSSVTINNLKGEYKDHRTQASASSGSVAGIEWPSSKLGALSLTGLTADVNTRGRAAIYEINADAALKDGAISGVNFSDTISKALYNNTALYLTGIRASVFGGIATGEFTLPAARGAASTAKAVISGLETKELVAYLATQSDQVAAEIPLSGKVSGEGEISFAGSDARTISGNFKARFEGSTGANADAIPVSGDAIINAQNGVFNFENLLLSTGPSKIEAKGSLSFEGDSDLRVRLESSQAEQLVRLAGTIDAARPYIADYEPQLAGDFKFEGVLRSRPRTGQSADSEFILEGDVNAASAGMRKTMLGSLTGRLYLSDEEIRVENGVITSTDGDGRTAKFDLATPFDSQASSGKLNAVIDRYGIDAIIAALGTEDVSRYITGDVIGEANLTGLPASPNGTAKINLINGTIAEQPIETAKANLKFDSKKAFIDSLEVRLLDSSLTGQGEISLEDYAFKANFKSDQISLESLAKAFELTETQIEGTGVANLNLSGKILRGKETELDWESLNVEFTGGSREVKINGREAGGFGLRANTSPGGRVDFSLATNILRTTQSAAPDERPERLRGNIELRKPGRPILVESNFDNQALAPLFELFAPELNPSVAGTITGLLRLEGPTADQKGDPTYELLRGGFTLSGADIQIFNIPVKIETPATIALEDMQIKIARTRISGQGIALDFGGELGLKGDAGMNFALAGSVNLDQLPPVSDDLLLNGLAMIDAKLSGTADKPNLTGQLNLERFGLSSGNLPVFVTDGSGRINFSGDQLILESFKAAANDGTLEAAGIVKLVQLRPVEWRYNIKADNASFDYQDISANISGALALSGTPQGQTLSGTITIPQAEYSPKIDLDNLLGGGSANLLQLGFGSSGGGAPGFPIPTINLNIRLEARDSLIVRTDQINAVGSAAINLTGTLNDPNLTGRIETDGGSVRFRGQRYEITTGALDMPPGSGQPLLNLLAEGDLSGYRVTIGFIGPIDDIDLTLRTEPQLVRDEILALITTGRTEAGTLASADPLRTGVGAAASLLSSGFISKPTEQLLGLSRFQIDPVIRPNANPAARLTVGQQISRNFYLSYSTNLATEQDQTALGEYTFSNRFSALATFTQGGVSTRQGASEGVFTIELRGRKRFSLGFSPDPPSTTAGGAGATISQISRPRLPFADVQVTPVQDLKLKDSKLRELLPVMTQGFSRSLARLGERRLREHLQEHGYFFAEVKYRCEPVSCSGDDLKVLYEIEPSSIYDLKEIRIEGSGLVRLSDIEGELQSQTASQVGGIPFLKDLPLIGGYVRGLTSNDRLRSDENLIASRLQEIGFRNARVRSRLAVKPENDELLVIFEVEEGVQSDVAGINVRGNAILPSDELRDSVPIQTGEAFSFTRARAGVQTIKQLYAELGFLETTAELELVDVDADSVMLVYNINEGRRAIVNEIDITGLTKTGKGWVRRYLDFKNGEVLTPAKIRQTQRDLYATNAFREVSLRAEPVPGDEGHKVSLNLTEAKPLLFVYGLGYSTDDGARGLMEIANANLFGSLDSLTLRLRGSRREQFGQLSFTDLRPFSWKIPTTISVFYNRSTRLRPFVRRRIIDEENKIVDSEEGRDFGLQRFAAFIQTERKLGSRTSLRFRYNLERANLFGIDPNVFPDTEVTRNERAIRLGLFSVGISRDTRDSVLNPTRGQLISADHSIAANILGGNESYNKFFATLQRYRTLDRDFPLLHNTTLAVSARIGLAALFNEVDRDSDGVISESEKRLPISERFFSGGATTLRGFRFETAGPQEILEPRANRNCATGALPCDLPTLVPIGGDALAIFNFELRYPLSERLRLVPFYDIGNVFRRVNDFKFNNFTHTIGLGLRITTPLGPVGVDYGYLIDPPAYTTASGAILRQPRSAIHIRLGQSF